MDPFHGNRGDFEWQEDSQQTSESPSNLSSDMSMDMSLDQRNKYWQLEAEMRTRTFQMTARERSEMEMLAMTPVRKECLDRFGEPMFANLIKDWLLELLNDGCCDLLHAMPGQDVPSASVMWTLCKYLMHADRAIESTRKNCHCCNFIYFQPHGCHCQSNEGIRQVFPNKLCPKCSQCMRCLG